MKKEMFKIKNSSGITLLVLVITIIILLILAGVVIAQLTNGGLLKNSKKATNEYNKQIASEKINLKILDLQMTSYAENKEMPTLQKLADGFCEDNEIEYVLLNSKTASLNKIEVGSAKSIFTKLKDYPYEFEINSSLQLASIDGVKVDNGSNNDSDNGNSSIGQSKVFSSLSCTAQNVNSQIVIKIEPTFYEGKSENDVFEYLVIANNKIIASTKEKEYTISKIKASTTYAIEIIGIDIDTGMIRSSKSEVTTDNLTYVREKSDYPVITSTGIYNIVYRCEQNTIYNYYEYVPSEGNTTASDSFPINCYDKDLTTNTYIRYNAGSRGITHKARVDKSAWGKNINVKASHNSGGQYELKFNFLNDSNEVLSYISFSKQDTTKSIAIPEGTTYVGVSCNGGDVYVYEISI